MVDGWADGSTFDFILTSCLTESNFNFSEVQI